MQNRIEILHNQICELAEAAQNKKDPSLHDKYVIYSNIRDLTSRFLNLLEIVKKATSPQISLDVAVYKQTLLEEKAKRYRQYINLRNEERAQVPVLVAQRRAYELRRIFGTMITLVIPGAILVFRPRS